MSKLPKEKRSEHDKVVALVADLLALKRFGTPLEYGGADIVIPWEPIQELADKYSAIVEGK